MRNLSLAFLSLLLVLAGCKNRGDVQQLCGVLDLVVDTVGTPQQVDDLLSKDVVIDNRFENIFTDSVEGISVWSLLRTSENEPSEGYGIIVKKGDAQSAIADVRHGNMPSARYDKSSGVLYLSGADTEGTGVRVERFYEIVFDSLGKASVESSIDPYDVQEAFIEHLGYQINGENITFFADGRELATVTNTVGDMGGFDENAVWIGEQLSYDLSGDDIKVSVVPGIKFVVGKVLTYEDTPTITATLETDGDKLLNWKDIIKDIKAKVEE